ncbi:MAG: hypothetical protein AB7I50_17155 [Vicinamibacterales bacterium]
MRNETTLEQVIRRSTLPLRGIDTDVQNASPAVVRVLPGAR